MCCMERRNGEVCANATTVSARSSAVPTLRPAATSSTASWSENSARSHSSSSCPKHPSAMPWSAVPASTPPSLRSRIVAHNAVQAPNDSPSCRRAGDPSRPCSTRRRSSCWKNNSSTTRSGLRPSRWCTSSAKRKASW